MLCILNLYKFIWFYYLLDQIYFIIIFINILQEGLVIKGLEHIICSNMLA